MHPKKTFFRHWILLAFAAILLVGAGCHPGGLEVEKKPVLSGNEKIAVMGFSAALDEQEKPQTVLDPLSGVVFSAAPVSPGVVNKMTQDLFDRLVSRGGHELISPAEATGAYSSIANRKMDLALLPARMLQKVGRELNADLVLAGYVYRWSERKGSDYGAQQAASVAFDLHLVRSLDGVVIWSGKFDKTQHSLTENLLDLWTFIKGGGRWMTAEKLAGLGLKQLLDKMP
ncbi:MAG: hypothetical protein WAL98_21305 [Desulfatiglandaceae bacterium]